MIDHKNHYARFQTLLDQSAQHFPSRRSDGGYLSALYILAADDLLFQLTPRRISADGISFQALTADVKRHPYTDSQLIAVKAAHSLFNDGVKAVTPADLAQCDFATLDIITNAIYVWKGRTPTADEAGNMIFDDQQERRARKIEAAFARIME